jgi:hypothetical protein
VQQYLSQYPVDETDIVHVEDGGWVNPDGDFGSPQSLNWNWPLIPANPSVWCIIVCACGKWCPHVAQLQAGHFDIEHGWSIDERNWAILTAAENTVETAEQARVCVCLEWVVIQV